MIVNEEFSPNKQIYLAYTIQEVILRNQNVLKIQLRYIVHFHCANKKWPLSEWYQLVVTTVFRISALGLMLISNKLFFLFF